MKKLFLRVALAVILTSVAIYVFARELSDVYALYGENERIKGNVETLKSSNDELQKKIENLKTNKLYIEKLAREQLGMIKQGEKVYRFEE